MPVTDAIAESRIIADIYTGSHPSAWRIRNNTSPDAKKDFVIDET